MKNYSKNLLSLFLYGLVLLPSSLIAQNTEGDIEHIIEKIVENTSEEYDYNQLREKLLFIYNNPVSLNTATEEELSELFFLNRQQIEDIIAYRKRYLGFKSIYELKTIPSLDMETILLLLPFVRIDVISFQKKMGAKDYFLTGRSNLILKSERILEKQAGYLPPDDSSANYYPGSPFKLYVLYNYSFYNRLSYGFVLEKDAGEAFMQNKKITGFDFYSFHFFRREKGKVKALALGDYYARFGQGLVFNSGFSLGKSPYIMQSYKSFFGLSPYSSVNESGYLRGVGITCRFGVLDVSLFASSRRIDGNFNASDTFTESEIPSFSSFYTTGLHRTQTETTFKKTIRESLAGVNLSASLAKINIGFTAAGGIYSIPILPSDQLYNLHRFSGDHFFNAGIDYSYTFKHIHFFGEIASNGASLAQIHGALINMGDNASGGIIYRHYPAEYTSPFANAFRENSLTNNEEGIYLAFSFIPVKKVKINTYVDRVTFPWLKYLTDAPSSGIDLFMDITYSPSYNTQHYFRFKYTGKEKNASSNETCLNYLVPHIKTSFRYQLTHKLSKSLSLITRLEYTRYTIEEEAFHGFMSMQDVKYHHPGNRFSLTFRYALFNADSYYSRTYAFENDIPTSFSITALDDKGMRMYLVTNLTLTEYSEVWFKISRTHYFDKEVIGSSLLEIEGNNKTEIRILLQIKF